jgi:hypothetical protein
VHQRGRGSEIGAYDYVLAARELELFSRREVVRWASLISLAAQLEQTSPWAGRTPPQ